MFLSFILEKLDRSKGNNNWSNFSNLHRSDILPQSEISNRFELTHVNKLIFTGLCIMFVKNVVQNGQAFE